MDHKKPKVIPQTTCAEATEIWDLLSQVKINDHHAMQLALIEQHRSAEHHEPDCFVERPKN